MMKMPQIDSLIIESTRRCNQSCDHCLRGETQSKDMNAETIEAFLEQMADNGLDHIQSITFSGGEPMLNPSIISETVDLLEKHQISVGYFYIATGAKATIEATKEFIQAAVKMYCYCDEMGDDPEYIIGGIDISNDPYHDNDEKVIRMLKALAFTKLKHQKTEHYDTKYVIREGRGADFGTNRKPSLFELPEGDDEYKAYSVYLNCNGDLIVGCDFSYVNQDRMKKGNVRKEASALKGYLAYFDGLSKRYYDGDEAFDPRVDGLYKLEEQEMEA